MPCSTAFAGKSDKALLACVCLIAEAKESMLFFCRLQAQGGGVGHLSKPLSQHASMQSIYGQSDSRQMLLFCDSADLLQHMSICTTLKLLWSAPHKEVSAYMQAHTALDM